MCSFIFNELLVQKLYLDVTTKKCWLLQSIEIIIKVMVFVIVILLPYSRVKFHSSASIGDFKMGGRFENKDSQNRDKFKIVLQKTLS